MKGENIPPVHPGENLQALYDLEKTRDEIEEQLTSEITPLVRENLDFSVI